MVLVTAVVLAASWSDGGLTLDEVNDVVAFRAADLAGCAKGRLTGEAVLQFGVDPGGATTWNAVLAEGKPPRAVCIARALRQWTWPARSPGSRVQFGFGAPLRAPAVIESADAGIDDDASAALPVVARCVAECLGSKDQSGPVSMSLVLGPSGAVVATDVQPLPLRLDDVGLGECLSRELRGRRFPRAPGFRRASLEWFVGADTIEVVGRGAAGPASVTREVPLASPTDRALLRQSRALLDCGPIEPGAQVTVRLELDGDAGVSRAEVPGEFAWAGCVARRLETFRVPGPDRGPLVRLIEFMTDDVVIRVPPAELGGLDKGVIMDVIRAHQAEVKFCYERALQAQPDLGGKVTVAWTIGADGQVTRAEVLENTVADPSVANCVRARVLTWRFPEPEGGGVVNVTFPWLFKAAGRE